MKNAIIDIGSNSVRLLFQGKKTIENTQLAENLMNTGILKREAMERTFRAVLKLKSEAEKQGAGKVYAFATEAVRAAKNKEEFISMLYDGGVCFELLSPKQESEAGFSGAFSGGSPAIIDIGGASSELTVGTENGIVYAHSLPVGSVRLKDYSLDKNEQRAYMEERVKEYGNVPEFDKLISIGGSVSQLYAVFTELEPYDAEKVHNRKMTYDEIAVTVDKILSVPVEERTKIKGLHPKKIIVAPAGGVIALAVMDYLNVKEVLLSERDNLEGYAILRGIEL